MRPALIDRTEPDAREIAAARLAERTHDKEEAAIEFVVDAAASYAPRLSDYACALALFALIAVMWSCAAALS